MEEKIMDKEHMNYEELLDTLDDTLSKGWPVPFVGGRRFVDAEEIQDIIFELRTNLPDEIKRSRAIIREREELVKAAQKEANSIIKGAEERVKQLVQNEEIYKQAQAKANDMIAQAQTRAREVKSASYEYAEDILKEIDEAVTQSLGKIRQARQNLKKLP